MNFHHGARNKREFTQYVQVKSPGSHGTRVLGLWVERHRHGPHWHSHVPRPVFRPGTPSFPGVLSPKIPWVHELRVSPTRRAFHLQIQAGPHRPAWEAHALATGGPAVPRNEVGAGFLPWGPCTASRGQLMRCPAVSFIKLPSPTAPGTQLTMQVSI